MLHQIFISTVGTVVGLVILIVAGLVLEKAELWFNRRYTRRNP